MLKYEKKKKETLTDHAVTVTWLVVQFSIRSTRRRKRLHGQADTSFRMRDKRDFVYNACRPFKIQILEMTARDCFINVTEYIPTR